VCVRVGIGVADQICALLKLKHDIPVEQARKMFYMVDSKGLITATRGDNLASFKKPYARHDITDSVKDLLDVVKKVLPTGIIGLSGQANAFNDEIIDQMCQITERPIIFPLSNPTKNSECTAEQAFRISQSKCIFASGSPFPPVTVGETVFHPSQGNNMYIFPGLGFGAWLCRSKEVSDGMIAVAAASLADQVSQDELDRGQIYPPLENIRDISAKIATAVIEQAFAEGHARIQRPKDILTTVQKNMYQPSYLDYQPAVSLDGRIRLGSADVRDMHSPIDEAEINTQGNHHLGRQRLAGGA